MWFGNKKERLIMLRQLSFTSKASLKQQCLYFSGGSIKEAKELYDFLIADMPGLPDTDPVPPSWQENTKDTMNGIMTWIKKNKDTLAQGIDFVRSTFSKNPLFPAAAEEPSPALPPINDE